jgi:hypothetical protein
MDRREKMKRRGKRRRDGLRTEKWEQRNKEEMGIGTEKNHSVRGTSRQEGIHSMEEESD